MTHVFPPRLHTAWVREKDAPLDLVNPNAGPACAGARLAPQQARPGDGAEEGVRHDCLGALRPRAQALGRLALQQHPQQALRRRAQERCRHITSTASASCRMLIGKALARTAMLRQ